MIDRYSRSVMKNIWTDESKFQAFLDVEIACTHAFSKLNIVPVEDYLKIKNNAKFNVNRIREIENETKHDVIAFTRNVSESLGDEKKWVHYGLTSTDVVDTAYGLLYKKANDILLSDIDMLLNTLKERLYYIRILQ